MQKTERNLNKEESLSIRSVNLRPAPSREEADEKFRPTADENLVDDRLAARRQAALERWQRAKENQHKQLPLEKASPAKTPRRGRRGDSSQPSPHLEEGLSRKAFLQKSSTASSPEASKKGRPWLSGVVVGSLVLVCLVFLATWQHFNWPFFSASSRFDVRQPKSLANRDLRGREVSAPRVIQQAQQALTVDEKWLSTRSMANASGLFYAEEPGLTLTEDLAAWLLAMAELGEKEAFHKGWRQIEQLAQSHNWILPYAAHAAAPQAATDLDTTRQPLAPLPAGQEEAKWRENARQQAVLFGAEALRQVDDAQEAPDWKSQLMTMRALMTAQAWLQEGEKQGLEALSSAYLAASQDAWPPLEGRVLELEPQGTGHVLADLPAQLPGQAQYLPNSADDSPRKGTELRYIRLASLDLQALKSLDALDTRYAALRQKAETILLEGKSQIRPFFAQAYDPASGHYLTWTVDEAYQLKEQMPIWLSLLSQGLLQTEEIAGIEQLERNHQVYERYAIQNGQPLGEAQTSRAAVYGQWLRFYRWTQNATAWQRLEKDLRTKQMSEARTSPIFGLLYRDWPTEQSSWISLGDQAWWLLGTQ